MMKKHFAASLPLIAILLLLASCGVTSRKPIYLLNDDSLRAFAAGDQLVYAVVGTRTTSYSQEISGRITTTWSSSSETVYPENNAIAIENALMQRQEFALGGLASEAFDFHFRQENNGSLLLYALKSGPNDLLWILPSGDSTPGIQAFNSPLPGDAINIPFDVIHCQNSNCRQVGSGTQQLTYRGIERQTTPYAVFESYKYDYSLTTQSTDLDAFDNDAIATISGTRWYYPGLGVVKFTFSRVTGNDFQELIASLNSTSIALP